MTPLDWSPNSPYLNPILMPETANLQMVYEKNAYEEVAGRIRPPWKNSDKCFGYIHFDSKLSFLMTQNLVDSVPD